MDNFYFLLISFLAFFIIAGLFSFLINGLFLKFSSNLGMRNTEETTIRWASTSKPAIGGISFYIVFLLSIVGYTIFFNQRGDFLNIKFIGILCSVTLGFLMGLADDAYNTKPFLKFLVQFLCGIILIYTGTYISIFNSMTLNYLITFVWIIGMMNSINMLDNMDGITTVVSIAVILSALTLIFLFNDILSINTIMLIGVLAALIGFLYYNWNPSKIYMGDTGSQFLGCFLGIIGIVYFWNPQPSEITSNPSKQLISALLIFIMPIIDTSTVTIRRLMKKQSPFVGGKDHTTHNLSYLGLTDRQVAITFLMLSLISLTLVVVINKFIENWTNFHFTLFSSYILVVFTFLFSISKKEKHKVNQDE